MSGIKFFCRRYSKNASESGKKQMKMLTKCPLMILCDCDGWLSFAALQNVFHKINKQKLLEIFCSTIYLGYVYIPRLVDITNYRWVNVTAVMGIPNQKERNNKRQVLKHCSAQPLSSSHPTTIIIYSKPHYNWTVPF